MTFANLVSLPDGLVGLFALSPNSTFWTSQADYLSSKETELAEAHFSIVEISENKSELDQNLLNLLNQCPLLAKKTELVDCLLVFKKKGETFELLVSREKPEAKYDWASILVQFAKNYTQDEADSDGLWAWGQKVKETGEYLCRDCGYIEEFTAGGVFPVCEVCLAGDPEGPMEVSAGYWEKL